MINYKKEFILPLLLASLILCATMGWLFFAMYQLVDLSSKKDIVDRQRYNIVALRNAILEAESGQRGYLITNNATFLETYDSGRQHAQQSLAQISKLDKRFPEIIAIVAGVKKLADEKFNIMNQGIQIQLNAGAYASHLSLSKDNGKVVMAEITSDLAAADAILLDYRTQYESRSQTKIKEAILGAIALVVIIFAILLFSYRRTLKLFEQILESRATVDYLSYQATHDALTNIPNRRGFEYHLKNVHAVALRASKKYAIFYMDLDGFKAVNDLYGHETGDVLLIEVAKLFANVLREYDYLARLGGDEFALIVNHFELQSELASLAERLIAALEKPLKIKKKNIRIGVSIGIAEHPKDGRSIDLLQVEADSAMYQSKSAGKNRYTFAS